MVNVVFLMVISFFFCCFEIQCNFFILFIFLVLNIDICIVMYMLICYIIFNFFNLLKIKFNVYV